MEKYLPILLAVFLSKGAEASWYWPFEDDDKDPPRLSELVKNASETISDASDLVSDGKTSEAVVKYREALSEIARVEAECPPESKDSALMGTLKTKRAYVEAAIDSLLLNQARDNAKPVAVSDTSELERRLAEERSGVKPKEKPKPKEKSEAETEGKAEMRQQTPCEDAMKAISRADYVKADRLIAKMLEEKPNDAAALNLRAAKETAEGKYGEAEKSLDAAIRSNPRDYFAYYNMATLKLRSREDDRDGARRYYETGRTLGGPKDEELEELLK